MNESKPGTEIKFTITNQGVPTINSAYSMVQSEGVAAIALDLQDKGSVVIATGTSEDGVPTITLEDRHCSQPDIGPLTEVEFPQYRGYTVWAANCSRYTVAICLIKY